MAMYEYKYPHPAVTTDCVVFGFDGRELKVLLVERGQEPFKGMWAFPGGFMRIDETAEQCAARELREETGLELQYLRQLGTFSGVHRDPRERVVTIAFYALARHSEVRAGDDAARARWWAVDEVPQLAFDHDYILRQAMNRIRQDIHFEPIGFGLLDERFTIADMQRLYESILGVRFDRRNFYRKMLQTGILQEVAEPAPVPPAPPAPKRKAFFGSRKEMRTMDIDALFAAERYSAGRPAAAPVLREALPDSDSDDELADRGHGVGRKGKLFRFDQEKYDRMKENGNFRLEF